MKNSQETKDKESSQSLQLTKQQSESFRSLNRFSILDDVRQHDKRFYKKILDSNLGLISFYKSDGTLRHMLCTRNPLLIPESRYHELADKDLASIAKMVPVYDLDKQEFRSFKTERLEFFTLVHNIDAILDVRLAFLRIYARNAMKKIYHNDFMLALDSYCYTMKTICMSAYRLEDVTNKDIEQCMRDFRLNSKGMFDLKEYREMSLINIMNSIGSSDFLPDDFFEKDSPFKEGDNGEMLTTLVSSMLNEYIKERSTYSYFDDFIRYDNEDNDHWHY